MEDVGETQKDSGGGGTKWSRTLPVLQEDNEDAGGPAVDKEVQLTGARMHFRISERRWEKPWCLIGSGGAAASAHPSSARLSAHLIAEKRYRQLP